MNRFRDFDALLERVTLYDLRSYLERSGWKRTTTSSGKWQVFRLFQEAQNPLELVLPSGDRFTDIQQRISQAISSIAQIQNRTAADVCGDVVGTNTDSLLMRLNISDDGVSIPVMDASRQVKAIRNLLLFGACSELDQRPYFEQPVSGSFPLIENFQFCHTFRGSFGFEIASTVARPTQTDDLFTPPIQRRILERLARGLQLLQESVRRDDPAPLIESYAQALNAKMCDAITEFGCNGESQFDIEISWASSVAPSEEVSSFEKQFIGEHHLSMLNYVSERLKIVEPTPERIVGHVVNLHCASNPVDGHAKRTVALKITHGVHGPIEVKLTLGPDSYLLAIEAHSKGQPLAVTGQLQRKGNSWTLESITSIEVMGV